MLVETLRDAQQEPRANFAVEDVFEHVPRELFIVLCLDNTLTQIRIEVGNRGPCLAGVN